MSLASGDLSVRDASVATFCHPCKRGQRRRREDRVSTYDGLEEDVECVGIHGSNQIVVLKESQRLVEEGECFVEAGLNGRISSLRHHRLDGIRHEPLPAS